MIQSDLLYLTPVSKNDVDLFIEIYTDPQIMEHVGPAFNQKSCKNMFNQCMKQISSKRPKNLFYVIKNKQNNKSYGIIGLLWNQPKENSVELGVMIAKPYISKGYAYKATYLLTQYVFRELNLSSMVVLCKNSNTVANRITKAIGFQIRKHFLDNNSSQANIKWFLTAERFYEIYKY